MDFYGKLVGKYISPMDPMGFFMEMIGGFEFSSDIPPMVTLKRETCAFQEATSGMGWSRHFGGNFFMQMYGHFEGFLLW